MKKFIKPFSITIAVVLVPWALLTLWVQVKGPKIEWTYGNTADRSALIVYDPDPIYDLEAQVCKATVNRNTYWNSIFRIERQYRFKKYLAFEAQR